MMTNQETQSREIAVLPQTDFGALATQQSRAVLLPASLAEAMKLAEYMSKGIGVRQWMRGNPSACLAVIQIAMRWGTDPYLVANKSYYTNDTLSFESQLVNAVINTSGAIIGRLKVEFEGEATGGVGKETLKCKVSGRLHADPDQVFVHEQDLSTITIRNSPLWKVNPRQQLQYHATRAWARLYMPEVLLGIYTPDEIADGEAERIERQSTPRSDVKAPDRRDFVGTVEERPDDAEPGEQIAAEDAEFEPIQTVVAEEPEHQEAAADEPNPNAGGEPAADKPVHILDVLPDNEDHWALWKETCRLAIDKLKTRKTFDALRRRIAPAMEAAPPEMLGEVQDWLSDALIKIPEEQK